MAGFLRLPNKERHEYLKAKEESSQELTEDEKIEYILFTIYLQMFESILNELGFEEAKQATIEFFNHWELIDPSRPATLIDFQNWLCFSEKITQRPFTMQGFAAFVEYTTPLQEMSYREYLKTSHWQEIRQSARKQAEDKRQLCNAGGELHVHHRTYERRGFEKATDVTVLC